MVDFELPDELTAHEPPEARGRARDDVRLLVSREHEKLLTHTRFRHFPHFLNAGDVLVVNTSATINAAFDGIYEKRNGEAEPVRLHLSTPISNLRWVVELRRFSADGTAPLLDADEDERIFLPGGGQATLLAPFIRNGNSTPRRVVRLWVAQLNLPTNVLAYADEYGSPIRYGYVSERWPLSYYQTIFATEPGSVEMPSAGRAFTTAVVNRLTRKGVQIVPVLLHAGVASLDVDEPVYPERYRVSESTAQAINSARARGNLVVAVGTTVVRAIETVATPDGEVHPGSGWTNVMITPERGVYAVDGLLTGLHAPKASHLAMLEAVAGRQQLNRAYKSALRRRYLWHEFGDLHLILPGQLSTPTLVHSNRFYATC